MGTGGMSRRETWEHVVRRKADRIGCEIPKESYATRFRHKGSKDPRLLREEDISVLYKEIGIGFSSTSNTDEEIVVVDWKGGDDDSSLK
jgi:hypothetical protein